MTHTVKGFGIVNKAEIDVFLELSCFINDPKKTEAKELILLNCGAGETIISNIDMVDCVKKYLVDA